MNPQADCSVTAAATQTPPEPTETWLRTIAARFMIAPPVGPVTRLGHGLINATYSLDAGGQRYVMQRVNGAVFPEPERIMANLRVLNAHLNAEGDGSLRVPALIETREGTACVRDEEGQVWRLMEFIPDSINLERIETLGQAADLGAILGRFHRLTRSLPIERIGVSLPGFHSTPDYLRRFQTLTDGRDGRSMTRDVRDGAHFIEARAALVQVLDEARRLGRIQPRVTHGDPKLDNILFARDTGRALALIDLDTVQPGLIHHDIGDCLRSGCNRGGEGMSGSAQVRFDLALCEAILSGYASETRDLMTADDVDLLYDAIRLLPFELGLRFLTDHLEGNRYFRVERPDQNLHKAHIQFALVAEIERQEREIRMLIGGCFPAAR